MQLDPWRGNNDRYADYGRQEERLASLNGANSGSAVSTSTIGRVSIPYLRNCGKYYLLASIIVFRLIATSKQRLLPEWLPFHPWRWWVQTRSVYLPVSYLYVNKCQMPLNPLLQAIRDEIYVQPYSTIAFSKHCNTVAACDLKLPPSTIRNMANPILSIWDSYLRPEWLRRRVNGVLRALISREDENTSYVDLASVNQFLIMVAIYFHEGEGSPSLAKHREKFSTFLWQGPDGMQVAATDGVQIWDTAFSVIAVAEAGIARVDRFKTTMEKALGYLNTSQIRENLEDPYRQPRKGGWAFSTKENGFMVSDCSGEAMIAVMMLLEEWYVFVIVFECVAHMICIAASPKSSQTLASEIAWTHSFPCRMPMVDLPAMNALAQVHGSSI